MTRTTKAVRSAGSSPKEYDLTVYGATGFTGAQAPRILSGTFFWPG